MSDKINRLLEVADEKEKAEITILNNAYVETVKAYRQNPTAANKKNWDAAEKGLDRKVDELWEQYFSEQPAFQNIMEVLKYLEQQHFNVKKSKVYKDKKAGLLKVQPDGRVLKNDVLAYSTTLERRPDDHGKAEERTVELLKKKYEVLDTKAERDRFNFEREKGMYIPRKDFEMEITTRAAVLEAKIRHWIQLFAAEAILICGGDPRKAPEVIEHGNRLLDDLMNEYANTRKFEVIITSDEQGT